VEDDEDEDTDTDVFSPAKDTTDFDPTFDSPPPQSRYPTAPHQSAYASVTNGTPKPLGDDFFRSSGPAPATAGEPSQPEAPAVSHDWDALFAPLSSNPASPPAQSSVPAIQGVVDTQRAPTPPPRESESVMGSPNPGPPKAASSNPRPARPQPGRALSTGTEHDDPILKRLTAMGWSREESLNALEQFDYNIDKAADFLTFRA